VRSTNIRQTLSIAEVQRLFSVGFGRAGRIIDQLCAAGYISENTGESKARAVKISREDVDLLFGSGARFTLTSVAVGLGL
jgi:DNA segregation ATPase FtsK/SpoIIIE-like protein